jgi:hypothetical protein
VGGERSYAEDLINNLKKKNLNIYTEFTETRLACFAEHPHTGDGAGHQR